MSYSKIMIYCSALLLSTLECFGVEDNKRGESLTPNLVPAGYNAPAAIALTNSITVNTNASFLYYAVEEEGRDIVTSGVVTLLPNFSYASVLSNNQQVFFQPSSYSPGFKVGIGIGINNWNIDAEYTWIENQTNGVFTPPASSFGTPILASNNWFQSLSTNNAPLSATSVDSGWKVQMNLVDLLAGRPCYQSPHLIVTPFGGLRGVFIYQHANIFFTQAPNTVAIMPPQPISSLNSSKYWGVGPKFGVEAAVLLPKKFRLEGLVAWSLVSGQFRVKHHEQASSLNQVPSPITYSIRTPMELREILEMSLGIGWGSYFAEDSYHINVSASYDFAEFEGQNMIKSTMDGFLMGTSAYDLNLYTQGLNIKIAVDF